MGAIVGAARSELTMVRWTPAEIKAIKSKAARERTTIAGVIREAVMFDLLLAGYAGVWREVSRDAVREVRRKAEEILGGMSGPALREGRSR